jgi:hypothetical protein
MIIKSFIIVIVAGLRTKPNRGATAENKLPGSVLSRYLPPQRAEEYFRR